MSRRLPLLLLVTLLFASRTLFAQGFLSGSLDPPEPEVPVSVTAEVTRTSKTQATLVVTATIDEGFHIYAQTQPKPFLAAALSLDEQRGIALAGDFIPERAADVHRDDLLNVDLHEFSGTIRWSAPLAIDAAAAESLTLSGSLFYQACTDDRCLAPNTLTFTTTLGDAVAPAMTDAASDPQPAAEPFTLDDVQAANSAADSTSLLVVLPLAFLAGFLLNFMPCVLPVVGLKVLAFVEQSGSSRRRMWLLNVAYSAGLVSVMLVLASLAVFAGFGWGEQFSSVGFSVTLAAVVFAFGLSFLGVWEIPVPGLTGSFGSSSGSEQNEGYAGAFSKGVLSTILATPCSGPFLGSALTWAVTQPAYLTYLVFATVGIGMASPYLVIGAVPKLVRLLPKPGAWMVTFKQAMGFVLLATVVYLMSFLPVQTLVPTAALLLGIGLACWLLGGTLLVGSRPQKSRATALASLAIVASTAFSFGWLNDVTQARFDLAARQHLDSAAVSVPVMEEQSDDEIAWEPFTREALERHIAEGRTVFVDFTADWCLTCKSNEAVAVETDAVRTLLKERKIVALRADKTRPAPEIDRTLRQLGNEAASIPYYAVFPAERPNRPLTLDGVFTSPKPLTDALESATLPLDVATATPE